MTDLKDERPGQISFHAVQPGVLEGVYSGYLSARLSDEMFPVFQAALAREPITHLILNTLGMDGFENRVVVSGGPWMQAFKSQGGRMLIVLSESAAVRMAAGALGFASGVSIKVVATRDEVLPLLPAR